MQIVHYCQTNQPSNNMAGNCGKGSRYKGEKCLAPPRYPYTKNGQANAGRIRNAAARAAQNGDVAAIKSGGFCGIAKRNGVKSKLCSR